MNWNLSAADQSISICKKNCINNSNISEHFDPMNFTPKRVVRRNMDENLGVEYWRGSVRCGPDWGTAKCLKCVLWLWPKLKFCIWWQLINCPNSKILRKLPKSGTLNSVRSFLKSVLCSRSTRDMPFLNFSSTSIWSHKRGYISGTAGPI